MKKKMLKAGPALLKVTNALTHLTNRHTDFWVRHKRNLPIGADLSIDIAALKGVDVRQIFDVGANRGQTYTRFRNEFPEATIYCFEPIRAPFTELSETASGDHNVRCEMLALGEAPGTTEVRLNPADNLNSLRPELMNQSPSAQVQSVSIDTVDRYAASQGVSHIDLLKIDAEGFELPVIEGAHGYLSTGRISLVFAEVGFVRDDARHTNLSDLTEALYGYHFHLYGLYDVYHYRGHPTRTHQWTGFANALYVAEQHIAMSTY